MTQFTHTTRTQFKEKLISSLGDISKTYWIDIELDSLLEESLLTFGALSGFFKEEVQLATIEGKRLYDIFVDTEKAKPRLTFQNILNWFNRDLIEELSEINPVSDLFTLNEILQMIIKKYNSYQLATNLIISYYELAVQAENNIIILPDYTIDIVRLIFSYEEDGNTKEIILRRTDEQEFSYFESSSVLEEELPLYFSTIYGSPNEIKLYPIPNVSGKLKVLTINGIDPIIELDVETIINLPNNLVPYLKYGIEADVFSKNGILNDPARAAYCNRRWEEGILIGRNYTSILLAKANGAIINTDSLNKMDSYYEPELVLNDEINEPTTLGLAGFNIFQTDVLPNANVNSIELLINQNAPIPLNDEDFIDIELSYIEILLGYCMHIAQMKAGAADLVNTNSYFEDFIKTSANHNTRLKLKGISYAELLKKTKLEETQQPKLVEEAA